MCGTAGLFIGCAALSYCPRRMLWPEPDEAPEISGYRSPFRNWHDRASVRRAPRRTLQDGEDTGHFFSPELVPVARHSLIRALPPADFETILIRHLHRYLEFTAQLEYLVVNRTIAGIAHGSVGVEVPEDMRHDALKMYCDEAYHALFSVDLACQVTRRTGIKRLAARPFFVTRLDQILADLAAAERGLAELLFVIISETLISASLAEVPSGQDVASAVRETIQDHAVDEARHHAFFAMFLRMLWGQLTAGERKQAGLLVPQMIDAFLHPDIRAIAEDLRDQGISADDAEQVVAEIYTSNLVRDHMSITSRQTRKHFRELGAFDDPEIAEAMASWGFNELEVSR
jgi:P-aminobenzoate N-oxygenase AurF